jgi:hypothetical protein
MITGHPYSNPVAPAEVRDAKGPIDPLTCLDAALRDSVAAQEDPSFSAPPHLLSTVLAVVKNGELDLGEDPGLQQVLLGMSQEGWEALDQLSGGITRLSVPNEIGISRCGKILPALRSLNCLSLGEHAAIDAAKLHEYPAWAGAHKAAVQIRCSKLDGIRVRVPSGTHVTIVRSGSFAPKLPSIVMFAQKDGSCAERPRLIELGENEAREYLQQACQALAPDESREPAKTEEEARERALGLAHQLEHVSLDQGEVSLRRLMREDREDAERLPPEAWHALRALSICQGNDITRFDFGMTPTNQRAVELIREERAKKEECDPLLVERYRTQAVLEDYPDRLSALDGLRTLIVGLNDYEDLAPFEKELSRWMSNQPPAIELRCGAGVAEIDASSPRIRGTWEGKRDPTYAVLQRGDDGELRIIPGMPFRSPPLDTKGQPLPRFTEEYAAASAQSEKCLNGKALFPESGEPIWCRHLAEDWAARRIAHYASGEDKAFSYRYLKDTKAIAKHVSAETQTAWTQRKAAKELSRQFSPSRFGDMTKHLLESLAEGERAHYQLRIGSHVCSLELHRAKATTAGEPGRFRVTFYDPNLTGMDRSYEFDSIDQAASPPYYDRWIGRYLSNMNEVSTILPVTKPSKAFLGMGHEFVSEVSRSTPLWAHYLAFDQHENWGRGLVTQAFSSSAPNALKRALDATFEAAAAGDRGGMPRKEILNELGLVGGEAECLQVFAQAVLNAPASQVSSSQKVAYLWVGRDTVERAAWAAEKVDGLAARQRAAFQEFGRHFSRIIALDTVSAHADPLGRIRAAIGLPEAAGRHACGYVAATYCGALETLPEDSEGGRKMLDRLFPLGAGHCNEVIERLAQGDVHERQLAIQLANALIGKVPGFRLQHSRHIGELYATAYSVDRVEPSSMQLEVRRECSMAGLRAKSFVWDASGPQVVCEATSPIEAFDGYLTRVRDEKKSDPTAPPLFRYVVPAHLLEPGTDLAPRPGSPPASFLREDKQPAARLDHKGSPEAGDVPSLQAWQAFVSRNDPGKTSVPPSEAWKGFALGSPLDSASALSNMHSNKQVSEWLDSHVLQVGQESVGLVETLVIAGRHTEIEALIRQLPPYPGTTLLSHRVPSAKRMREFAKHSASLRRNQLKALQAYARLLVQAPYATKQGIEMFLKDMATELSAAKDYASLAAIMTGMADAGMAIGEIHDLMDDAIAPFNVKALMSELAKEEAGTEGAHWHSVLLQTLSKPEAASAAST